jgi:ribosomal protein S18 acetylase RimI-like enzyme
MLADNFDFRFATAADAAEVHALIERSYRGAVAATGWTNESELLEGPRSTLDEVSGIIADPQSRFVLAIANGELIASALIRKAKDGAYFGMFAVDPKLQQAGIGKMHIARCEADARRLWNARFLRLTVISLRDELIAWYERRGFVRTGEHEPFPFDEAPGALRTDFDLVVLQKPL